MNTSNILNNISSTTPN